MRDIHAFETDRFQADRAICEETHIQLRHCLLPQRVPQRAQREIFAVRNPNVDVSEVCERGAEILVYDLVLPLQFETHTYVLQLVTQSQTLLRHPDTFIPLF